jgi:glycine oxidase
MDDQADVIVIGAGVIGLSTALRLQQAGLNVALLERGYCGREASWAGAGIVSPGNPHRHDSLYEIHCASLDRYPDFCAELEELSGFDVEYRRCGALDFLVTEQFVQMAQSNVRVTAEAKTPEGKPVLELLTPEQAAEIEPEVTGECHAFLHCRRTAQVRNPRLLAALVTACERTGVRIVEESPVESYELQGERVVGATAAGITYHAKHVVLCAGAWSSQIGPTAVSALIPVTPVRGQIVLAKLPEPPFTHVINRRDNYLVPRDDGHVLIGTTKEPEAGYDKRNTAKETAQLMNTAVEMVPRLAEAAVPGMWAGLRPDTPDHRPYIGPVPGFGGLIAATGHFRIGLTLAPITADIVRDLIVNGKSEFDLERCKPGRSFV